jgi:hypothetical protein
VKAHRTGTYSGAVHNAAWDRSYPFTFAIANADYWEFKTVVIPGELSGAWDTSNGVGLELVIALASGSTWIGTPNAWASVQYMAATGTVNGVAATTDTFQMTGLIVLPGIHLPTAQKSALIQRSADIELPICQRQFCSDFGFNTKPANNFQHHRRNGLALTSTVITTERILFPRPLRALPTVSLFSSTAKASPLAGAWQFANGGTFADSTATTAGALDIDGFQGQLTVSGVTAAGAYGTSGSWMAEAGL